MSVYRRKDRGGHWWYRRMVKLPDGSKVRIRGPAPINTKGAAEKAERDHVERVLNPRLVSPTVREFWRTFEAYAELNNKDSEVASKRAIFTHRILPLLGDLRLDELTTEVIERFKAQLKSGERPDASEPAKGYGDKTVNNTLTSLRTMLGYAVRLKKLAAVPLIDKLKTAVDDFDFFDFDELERAVAGVNHDSEVQLIVLLGAEAGLRIGEVQALRWDDIDFTRRILTVNRRDWRGKLGSPKGGRIRRVPLTSRLVAALKAHRHLMAWVVCQPDGARYTHNHVTSRLARACRKAGLRIATYHVLRHTFCSHLAMRGASARAIQELAGHASITTTQRYMHLAPAAGRDAIDLLERRGPTVAPADASARK